MKQFFYTILYQPFYNLLILLALIIPGHSIAWAIIALTVLIRLALLPSSIKAAHHQARSLELQPKVNKIRAEIKDMKEQQAALSALYKEEGFSPFGSCLPLLIQIPIIIVLFSVFKSGLKFDDFSGLYAFIPQPDSINVFFLGFDMTKPDLWVLPIIAGLTQFVLSYLTTPPKKKQPGDPDDPMAMMTKQMVFFMPIVTIFIGRGMPAGLVVYWIVTTIFGIFQQLYVNDQIKKKKLELKPLGATELLPSTAVAGPEKKNFLSGMMSKRLDKQEKKAGVNVTVRTKKK
jgi:YidC/Oxa1 family membrane protein insertase